MTTMPLPVRIAVWVLVPILLLWAVAHYGSTMDMLRAVATMERNPGLSMMLANHSIDLDGGNFKSYYIRAGLHAMRGNRRAACSNLWAVERLVPDYARTRELLAVAGCGK